MIEPGRLIARPAPTTLTPSETSTTRVPVSGPMAPPLSGRTCWVAGRDAGPSAESWSADGPGSIVALTVLAAQPADLAGLAALHPAGVPAVDGVGLASGEVQARGEPAQRLVRDRVEAFGAQGWRDGAAAGNPGVLDRLREQQAGRPGLGRELAPGGRVLTHAREVLVERGVHGGHGRGVREERQDRERRPHVGAEH